MNGNVTEMTLNEIKLAGIDALARELGPYGLIRFLKQFESGRGDYTKERERWLPKDMETAIAGIKDLQANKGEKKAGD
jgi:hypothetical protein